MSPGYRTRFAPSPTGYLHIGHAFAAKMAFGSADHAHGQCLLRIEDIDQTRCRPEYEFAIYEDLAWLGFQWPEPVRRQSDHFDAYQTVLSRLEHLGLVYKCGLTRREVQTSLDQAGVEASPAGERPFRRELMPDGLRPSGDGPFAWRLSLTACRDYLGSKWDHLGFKETGGCQNIADGWTKACPDWLGDVIVARKDTPVSYHLAVCHDDALQAVTHIVRGEDLFFSTHIHVLLQAIMGWPTPVYCHHRVLSGPDGRKFSKSDNAKSIRSLREEGVEPDDIFLSSGFQRS